MTKTIFFVIFVVFISQIIIAQTFLTNDDVVEMVNTGLSSEIIIAKIKTSETKFDTTKEGLKKLQDSKIPDTIVVAMIERQNVEKNEAKVESKQTNKISDSIPEQGSLSDIKGKTKVYIFSEDLKSRDMIIKELAKKKLFEVVDKLEDSEFVIKFEVWEEAIGATGNVYGNTAVVTQKQVRVGVLTIMMPSTTSNRVRLIYSNKQTQRGLLLDHPAEKTTKQFLKDFEKLK